MNMLAPHLPRLCGFAHMPIAYLLLPFRALFSQLFPPLHGIPQRNTGMCVLTCMCVRTPVCVCGCRGVCGCRCFYTHVHVQYTCTAPFFEQLGLR